MAAIIPGAPTTYGMSTRACYGGGANPTIYRVTKLADDGSTGTLRWACQAVGNRLVIFEISGYIDLVGDLVINNPYLRVSGQTAPNPGITLRYFGLQIGAHDVLFEHLAIRPGGTTCNSDMQVYGGGQYNVVFSHVSFTWGQDENAGTNWTNGQSSDITFWRCIFAEGLYRSVGSGSCSGGGTGNGHGLLVGPESGRVAVLQSLFSTNYERNPYILGGNQVAFGNNVIYQWHGPWGIFFNNGGVESGSIGNPWHAWVVGTRFIKGPHSTDGGDPVAYTFLYSINGVADVAGNSIYRHDNTIANQDGSVDLETNQYSYDPNILAPSVQAPAPVGYVPLASTATEAFVLANAGTRPAVRDDVDARIMADVNARSGNFISSPDDVGGYPTLAVNVRALTTPTNPHVVQVSTYTTLEEWLQSYAAGVETTGSTTTFPWIDTFGPSSSLSNYTNVDHLSLSAGTVEYPSGSVTATFVTSTGNATDQYYSGMEFVPASPPVGASGFISLTSDQSASADNGSGNSLFEIRSGAYAISLYHGVGAGADRSVLQLYTGNGGFWESPIGVITPGIMQNIRMDWQWSSYTSGAVPQADGWITVTVDTVSVIHVQNIVLTTAAGQATANSRSPLTTSPELVTWSSAFIGPMGNGDDLMISAGPAVVVLEPPPIVVPDCLSDYLENRLIDHVFRHRTYTAPSALYVALFTSNPTDAVTGVEVSGSGYARVLVVSSDSAWESTQGTVTAVASSGNTGRTRNGAAVAFPAPTGDWGSVSHFAVFDAVTGGNMIGWGTLASAKTVSGGDPGPAFAPAAIIITLA